MNANSHKDCCLKLLKILHAIKEQDRTFTTNQLIELVNDKECANTSRVKTNIRELVRIGFLIKKAGKYIVVDEHYNYAYKMINSFENTAY